MWRCKWRKSLSDMNALNTLTEEYYYIYTVNNNLIIFFNNNIIKTVCDWFWRKCTLTSSSAVAERPRDALCPSVASLNKIITRAESFIIVT